MLRCLVVLVEGDHLSEDGLCDSIQRCQVVRSDSHFDVVQLADDWLKLVVVYTVQWLDYLEVVVLLLVLKYSCLDRCEVLLVTKVNVVEKRALARQERAGKFKRLGMPVL